jgi:hypothetical protein
MEATRYVRAFENFDEDSEKAAENQETLPEIIEKIGKVIDSGDFYCVISAYTDGTDADTQKEQHEKLKNDVLKLKYAYLEQSFGYCYSDGKGQTTVSRKSLIVALMNYDELLALGKKYNQEIIAFGGNGGMSVVRVSDEAVLLDMNTESMKLAWTGFICNPHNIPWQ